MSWEVKMDLRSMVYAIIQGRHQEVEGFVT